MLVKIVQNLDFDEIFLKTTILSKNCRKSQFGLEFSEISILFKICESLDFRNFFQKFSILIKF